MIDISQHTVESALDALEKGEFTSRDLVESCLKNIDARDRGEEGLNAVLEVFADALDEADLRDKEIASGVSRKEKPLIGIPVLIKDNITMKGKVSTAGSKILEGFVSPTDSTVVRKLKEAGAVVIGRTNMDEFGMGSSTENSAYGVTRNPYDKERVAGGSSGGSAAAVAAGFALVALGSDTGGSIREPAAFCGVVGFKPTYGRVSRSGLIALASSLDQIGPFTKSVRGTEIVLDVIKGKDPMDSTTIDEDLYKEAKSFSKVIGVPKDFINTEGVEDSVKENFKDALDKFESLGYKIKEVDLETIRYSLATYYILMPAEASSNLARFDGVKYGLKVEGDTGIEDYFKTRESGFGREARRRIILGTYVLSSGYADEYYRKALAVKAKIEKEFEEVFKEVDFILTPTTPSPAFKIGEKTKDPLSMYVADMFTVPANIAGLTSISIPFGKDGDLPLGVELTAGKGREDFVIRGAKEFLGEK